MHNGFQIGCKKIMVLYGAAGGGSKAYKLNWVMHQYHLGTIEEEKEGEYVVAKIFYQPQKQTENHEELAWMSLTSPRTPNIGAPDAPRARKSVSCEDVTTDYVSSHHHHRNQVGVMSRNTFLHVLMLKVRIIWSYPFGKMIHKQLIWMNLMTRSVKRILTFLPLNLALMSVPMGVRDLGFFFLRILTWVLHRF